MTQQDDKSGKRESYLYMAYALFSCGIHKRRREERNRSKNCSLGATDVICTAAHGRRSHTESVSANQGCTIELYRCARSMHTSARHGKKPQE